MTGPRVPIGAFVAGLHGEPLGHIAAVYVDNATGRAAWAAVQSGRHAAVVPMQFRLTPRIPTNGSAWCAASSPANGPSPHGRRPNRSTSTGSARRTAGRTRSDHTRNGQVGPGRHLDHQET